MLCCHHTLLNERPTRLPFPLRNTMIIIWRDPSPIYVTYRQPLNDAKEKISQSCWSLLSKLYLSRNWLQSRPPATGNDQGHGSRQDLQTSHSDTATTHKNTNSNMNMTLNYNHKGSYMIIHEICHDRRSWNFFQVLCTF